MFTPQEKDLAPLSRKAAIIARVEICRGGEFTGATPGTVFRSGRDTAGTAIG